MSTPSDPARSLSGHPVASLSQAPSVGSSSLATPNQSLLDSSTERFFESEEARSEETRLQRNAKRRERYAANKAVRTTPVRKRHSSEVRAQRAAHSTPVRRASQQKDTVRRRQRRRAAHSVELPPVLPEAEEPSLRAESPADLTALLDDEPSPLLGQDSPAVRKAAEVFASTMEGLTAEDCVVCREAFPGTVFVRSTGACRRCHGDKRSPRKYSADNNMNPGEVVPECLSCLTPIEEMLIAQVACIMSVHRLPGGQLGYSGNVINFPQDVKEMVRSLPRTLSNAGIIVVKRGSGPAQKTFRVRRDHVLAALSWLKLNNPYYKNIEISQENLDTLPHDDFVDDLIPFITDDSVPAEHRDMGPVNAVQGEVLEDQQPVHNAFVPSAGCQMSEEEAIHFLLAQNEAPSVATMAWPTMDSRPVNEFETCGYDVCAFPTLFPYGTGGLRCPRIVTVTPVEYAAHLLRFKQKRFRSHPRFAFFLFNSIQRWRAATQGSLFFNYRTPEDKNLSAAQFRQKYAENSDQLCRRIMHFGKTLKGTPQFWMHERTNLLEMIKQLGCPSLFFTLSSADLHWPDLHRLLPYGVPGAGIPSAQQFRTRMKNLSDDPDVASWYFYKRVKVYLETVLKALLDVEDFWFRFEWQARGSPHIHGFLWIRSAPKIETLHLMIPEQKQEVADWFGSLITTWNEDAAQPNPAVHPCQRKWADVRSDPEDYISLANMIQRHTRCAIGYCLRKKKANSDYVCRFEFPKVLRDTNELVIQKNHHLKLATRRNDELLNAHNKVMLKTWRANVDVSALTDPKEVAQYAAKYSSKPEPRSKPFTVLYEQILGNLKETDKPRTAASKLLIKSVGERDYTAQEIRHHLHGLPLVECSRSFVRLFLFRENNLRRIRKRTPGEEDADATESDTVRKYTQRQPELEEMTLRVIVTRYTWNPKKKTWGLRRDGKANIVVIVPAISPDATSPEYCRQRMLLDVPFRCSGDLCHEGTQSWVDVYRETLMPDLNQSLPAAEVSDEEYENEIPAEPQRVGWMVASAMGPNARCEAGSGDLGHRAMDVEHDWSLSMTSLESKDELTGFVERQKRLTEIPREKGDLVDILQLNADQRRVYDFVERYHVASSLTPLRMIIQGTAGTGRSFLIKALMQLLNEEDGVGEESPSAVLLAPTGCAAFLVDGFTIHCYLRIPPKTHQMADMKGKAAKNFQSKFSRTRYVLIEERSMVGCRLFVAMDRRLKQAFPSRAEEPFGGLSMVLIGDHFQLPPVCDAEVFVESNRFSGQAVKMAAYALYRLFDRGAILRIQQRQDGSDPVTAAFRELLLRLRVGGSTEDDFRLLMSRQLVGTGSCLTVAEVTKFIAAVRLFTTRDACALHNVAVLKENGRPVAAINAVHTGQGAATSEPDEARGLEPILYLSVGCRVVLKMNLWTSQGLVNGATGVVEDVFYEPDASPPSLPVAVLVKFDSYTGPSLRGFPGCVPIEPVKCTWKTEDEKHYCSRTQMPLARADAVTVHTSQGRTVTTGMVVNIGKTEFSCGLSFVAFSRVKRLEDLAIDGVFDFDRLKSLAKSPSMLSRINEEARIERLSLDEQLGGQESNDDFQRMVRQFSAMSPEKAVSAKRFHSGSERDSAHLISGSPLSFQQPDASLSLSFREVFLQNGNYSRVEMPMDGNCLYSSLAYAVWSDRSLHLNMRRELLTYMNLNRDQFLLSYVNGARDLETDLTEMETPGTWGNAPQILAASFLFSRDFRILSNNGITTISAGNFANETLLDFHELHYEILE